MEINDILRSLSSKKRYKLLKALNEEPLNFMGITKEIDESSTETSLHLAILEENRLIAKDGARNYSITPYGKLVLSNLSRLEFITQNFEYFLEHGTSPNPSEHLRRLYDLSGLEVVSGAYKISNIISSLIDDIVKYHWRISIGLTAQDPLVLEKKIDNGLEFKAILPSDAASYLVSMFDKETRENIDLRVLDEASKGVLSEAEIWHLKP